MSRQSTGPAPRSFGQRHVVHSQLAATNREVAVTRELAWQGAAHVALALAFTALVTLVFLVVILKMPVVQPIAPLFGRAAELPISELVKPSKHWAPIWVVALGCLSSGLLLIGWWRRRWPQPTLANALVQGLAIVVVTGLAAYIVRAFAYMALYMPGGSLRLATGMLLPVLTPAMSMLIPAIAGNIVMFGAGIAAYSIGLEVLVPKFEQAVVARPDAPLSQRLPELPRRIVALVTALAMAAVYGAILTVFAMTGLGKIAAFVAGAVFCAAVWLHISFRDGGFDWRQLAIGTVPLAVFLVLVSLPSPFFTLGRVPHMLLAAYAALFILSVMAAWGGRIVTGLIVIGWRGVNWARG